MKKTWIWALPWLCLCLNFGCATEKPAWVTHRHFKITGRYFSDNPDEGKDIVVQVENDWQLNRIRMQLAENGFMVENVQPIPEQ